MNKLFRVQFFTLMIAITFYATYAFASSDTNSPPAGGEGANTISGRNVTNISYSSADDPSKLTGVEFDLDGSADIVKISLLSSGSSFYGCQNTSGTHWFCMINPGVGISEVDELRVITMGD